MCELFAMSTRVPSTVTLSLEEFSSHGGLKGPHKDGWGIAWYDAAEVHVIKESLSASTSAAMKRSIAQPFHSDMVLCHIRKATQGTVATRNCQPFIRELGGVWHSFAHNGDLTGIRELSAAEDLYFQPVGETDSEYAFCTLMQRLRPLWRSGRVTTPPPLAKRVKVIADFARTLRSLGPANFLYADGELLFAHGHKRHQPDGTVRAPGLWQLKRHCTEGGVFDAQGLTVTAGSVEQEVALFASVPLTSENWEPLNEGCVIAIERGRHVATA